MKKILLLTAICCLGCGVVFAQVGKNTVLTADSLATGNYKDVLNSFFQIAVNTFTGPDKELKFTSNPFAIMAKMNPDLLRTGQYLKYKRLRKLNFAFAARLDTSYKFNGFSSGVKYALIDRRDETVSRAFLIEVETDSLLREFGPLQDSVELFISSLSGDTARQNKFGDQVASFYHGELKLDQLDVEVRDKLLEIAKRDTLVFLLSRMKKDPAYSIRQDADKQYAALKKNFNNRFLWTVGVSDTTYKDQFMFSNVVFSTEAVQGLLKNNKQANIEYNVKAAYQLVDDTLKAGRDLKRGILNVEGGFNFILNAKDTDRSWLEFKVAGSYYYRSGSLYKDEKRDMLTLNGTLRIRVFSEVWVPLEIKYDPKNGDWFGLLNVRLNFNALGKDNKKS
jgi:hypothetical protein